MKINITVGGASYPLITVQVKKTRMFPNRYLMQGSKIKLKD